jgi:hypothetical protein
MRTREKILAKAQELFNRNAELHYKGKVEEMLLYYLETCCSLIEPHLTEAALAQYQIFFKKIKNRKNIR